MAGGSARILVVDDQQDIRELTATILRDEGHTVVTRADGEHALEALFGEPFDLVLLDINMPGMDGWETLRLIRADDALAGTPVVMFSVRGEIRNQIQGMQLGAAGYVTKPFSIDELLAGIRRHLGGDRPSEARPG